MDILGQIIAQKRTEVADRRSAVSLEELRDRCAPLKGDPPRSLRQALTSQKPGSLAVIAEFKRKSPSKGLLRKNADPAAIARGYEAAGAAALSVLTDETFFAGSADDLRAARASVRLPVLRKDFLIDAYQVWESRFMGADAVLLIRSILNPDELSRLHELARSLSLETLWEFHGPEELKGLAIPPDALIGVNNRDLKTFEVDLGQTERMMAALPSGRLVISESGISTRADLHRLKKMGVSGILIGESLMRSEDPGAALAALTGGDLAP